MRKRYERSADRIDTRAGSYDRKLQTKAGEITLKVPRLRSLPVETQIIEHYRRHESSVEEALMEMYLAGVCVRRVENFTEALWGTRVSSSAVSELNQQLDERIKAWLNQPIESDMVKFAVALKKFRHSVGEKQVRRQCQFSDSKRRALCLWPRCG